MMGKGHNDAQFYRMDFAEVVVKEIVSSAGIDVKQQQFKSNEDSLKEIFGS